MKKSKTRIYLIGMLFGIFTNISCQYFSPLKSGLIIENVYAIKNDIVNMYLIQNGESYIAIDAGRNPKVTAKELVKLKINPDMVTTILLTHVDVDHIGGIDLFKNSKIYIGKGEEKILMGEVKRFSFKEINREYNLLYDGDVLEIDGLSVKAVSAPGHTPGSLCFIVNDNLLFTGDTLSIKKGRVGVFFPLFNVDTELQKKSIDKIKRLEGIEYIFTGHNGYSDNFREMFENWEL
jgi:glyoxylase-like metal-dependent hydrolase (beta-lactamase superfamily II)